jgi:hypothetical protein
MQRLMTTLPGRLGHLGYFVGIESENKRLWDARHFPSSTRLEKV